MLSFSGFKSLLHYIVCLFSIGLFACQPTFAQESISGKIVNEQNEALPFVHIRVEGTEMGTISNENGLFRLVGPTNIIKKRLVISTVGYRTKRVLMSKDEFTIVLETEITQLKGITVVPLNRGKELILKAIRAIPKNYPGKAEYHHGFFREATTWGGEESPIYVAEAFIRANKRPYDKKTKSGDIQLLEFRKYESAQLDTLDAKIYAGGHHIHRFDLVAKRDVFLSNPDAFTFKILDTLRYDGRDLYKVYFENSQKASGNVFIADSSFAITKIELAQYSFFELGGPKRKYLNVTVAYEQGQDHRWRFKNSHYTTAFQTRGRLLHLVSDYVSTEVKTGNVEIPYTERLQFEDILLEQSQEYDPHFWDGHTIILPDATSETVFGSDVKEHKGIGKENNNKKESFLRKFRQEIAVATTAINVREYQLGFSNSAFPIDQNGVFSKKNAVGLHWALLYEFRPRFFVGYANETKISRTGINSHDLILRKNFNLNPVGRPLFLAMGAQLGFQEMGTFLGNYDTNGKVGISGKIFDTEKVDVFLAQRNFRWLPSVALQLESSHRISFFLSASYNFPLSEKSGLVFKEKSGFFLTRKSAFLKNGEENLLIEHESRSVLESSLRINTGVVVRF